MAEEETQEEGLEEEQEDFIEDLKRQKEQEEIEREISLKSRKRTKEIGKDVKKSSRELAKGSKKGAEATKVTEKGAKMATNQTVNIKAKAKARAKKIATDKAKKAVAKKIATQVAVKVLLPVIGWIALGIFVVGIIGAVVMSFINDKNEEFAGLGGGSQPVGADSNFSEHRDMVDNLLSRTQGSNPSLVIRGPGANDLDWVDIVINGETGETTTVHPIDLRVLKAIEYLTNLHEYIEIGMLRTDAPNFVRDSVIIDSEAIGGEDTEIVLDTLSAFSTGQAFSIIAVDRTKIPELIPASGVAPPIKVSWQKTLIERAIRPLWEEITFNIGVLDRNIPIYKAVLEGTYDTYGEAFNIERNLSAARNSGDADLYKNSFRILKRIIVLLDRALGLEDYLEIDLTNAYALDSRAIKYFTAARDQLFPVVDYIENNILNVTDLDELDSSPGSVEAIIDSYAIIEAIKYLGQANSLERIHNGARLIYKATQVANMVGWDKAKNLDLKKAYEARNKIRQVIKELLEMPREVSLFSDTSFDVTMVAKQVITFSPEDDLDNGAERMDVYPYGIKYVDTGGIAMEVLVGAIADGIIDYPDIHFSHAPISANGVFSKGGVNYIDKISPDDNPLENALDSMDEDEIEGQSKVMHNLLIGECVLTAGENCQKSSYKNYIYVGF